MELVPNDEMKNSPKFKQLKSKIKTPLAELEKFISKFRVFVKSCPYLRMRQFNVLINEYDFVG